LIYQTDATPGFYFFKGPWTAVSGTSAATEIDPQVGTITSGRVPRWNGTELTTGAIADNGTYVGVGAAQDSRYRILSRTTTYGEQFEMVGKAAVRGESNGYSGLNNTIRAIGYLGVKNPTGIYTGTLIGLGFPHLDVLHIGGLGVKEQDSLKGAGLYGWNRGGAATNYGTVGAVSMSTPTGTGYGIYGKGYGGGITYGVYGKGDKAAITYGVYGEAEAVSGGLAYGVYGKAAGGGNNYAGYFAGRVQVVGTDETLVLGGTNPYIQMKAGSKEVGYLRANVSNLEIATNSGNTGNLVLRTNGGDRMLVTSNGRVAINTAATRAQFNVKGTNETVNIDGSNPSLQISNGGALTGYIRAMGGNFMIATNGGNTAGKLDFRTKDISRMWIDANGNVSIGGSGKVASGYLLSVVGKVMAEEVRVELNGTWPDYVFASDYQLMKLAELKKYIKANKHLPEIPAAEEMKAGIEMGKMNKLLMQKVEELTLYVIQLSEAIEELKNNK
jgi:hypothetical protein